MKSFFEDALRKVSKSPETKQSAPRLRDLNHLSKYDGNHEESGQNGTVLRYYLKVLIYI